jgi:hypothetical protein
MILNTSVLIQLSIHDAVLIRPARELCEYRPNLYLHYHNLYLYLYPYFIYKANNNALVRLGLGPVLLCGPCHPCRLDPARVAHVGG